MTRFHLIGFGLDFPADANTLLTAAAKTAAGRGIHGAGHITGEFYHIAQIHDADPVRDTFDHM